MEEKIIEILENSNSALDIITIADRLGLTTVEDIRDIQNVIEKLMNEHLVYLSNSNKYILYSKCPNLRTGKVSFNKKGFGFLDLEEKEGNIHIAKNNMGFALKGDTVLVEIIDNTPGKREGKVIRILERDLNNIVGEIKSDGKKIYFEPLDSLNIILTIDEDSLKKCVEGEIVVVTVKDDLGKNRYTASVEKHICHKDDPKSDILAIAAKYDIYEEFPEEAIKQAEELPNEIAGELLLEEKKSREDLTEEMIYTIDGADTKDIDDAISIKKDGDNYILTVSIADVSYYVTEGSPLDLEAYNRGTSSYLAYSVIPMLPHKLSNGICSLNPNAIRCAMSCKMVINPKGRVIDYDIFASLIESKKKMTYTAVNSILEDNIIPEGYEEFKDNLLLANELAHIIRKERQNRGASDFDIPEPKIICDDTGKCINIEKRERGEGERLIEDFMIAANETVASALYNLGVPSVYRLHGEPNQTKVQELINFCSQTNHPIKGKFKTINPKAWQSMMNQLELTEDEEPIYKSLFVRSMQKAYYGVDNIGHFGLASKCYTHFTSPIRRYPDLQVHRLIREYLIKGKMDLKTINYWEAKLPEIADNCSDRELAAVEAEREVDKIKMAEYMEDHVGEEFVAVISGVSNIGMFVRLDNLVEGLVSVSSLTGDYFEYVEDLQSLIGKSTKKIYTVGVKINVKCTASNKATGLIDFEIVKELKKTDDIKSLKKVNNYDRTE